MGWASAQEVREWSAGLNWYLNRNVRLVLVLGNGFRWRCAVSASASTFTVRDRATEQVVMTRTQISF